MARICSLLSYLKEERNMAEAFWGEWSVEFVQQWVSEMYWMDPNAETRRSGYPWFPSFSSVIWQGMGENMQAHSLSETYFRLRELRHATDISALQIAMKGLQKEINFLRQEN